MNSEQPAKRDIANLLRDFDRTDIVNSYGDKLRKEPAPPLIYHYTDDAGLRGIFESGRLWCTDIFSLNDTSEIRYGVANACELLDQAATKSGAANQFRVLATSVIKELTARIEESGEFFVCCFSKAHDDLGQWRAYADDGRGFAIGFSGDVLERAFVDAAPKNGSTFPLSYLDAELREIQARLVDQVQRIFAVAPETLSAAQMGHLSTRLSALVIHSAVFFKNHGYSNEQEYRFLLLHRGDIPVPGLKVRSKPYSLVRYLEFDWKQQALHALREVRVGPAADPRTAFKFVEDCRRTYLSGDYTLAIMQSQIPYRSTPA